MTTAKTKSTPRTTPSNMQLMQLVLVNKEINRLTNAIHKAEMHIILEVTEHYRENLYCLIQDLETAKELKAGYMERHNRRELFPDLKR